MVDDDVYNYDEEEEDDDDDGDGDDDDDDDDDEDDFAGEACWNVTPAMLGLNIFVHPMAHNQ